MPIDSLSGASAAQPIRYYEFYPAAPNFVGYPERTAALLRGVVSSCSATYGFTPIQADAVLRNLLGDLPQDANPDTLIASAYHQVAEDLEISAHDLHRVLQGISRTRPNALFPHEQLFLLLELRNGRVPPPFADCVLSYLDSEAGAVFKATHRGAADVFVGGARVGMPSKFNEFFLVRPDENLEETIRAYLAQAHQDYDAAWAEGVGKHPLPGFTPKEHQFNDMEWTPPVRETPVAKPYYRPRLLEDLRRLREEARSVYRALRGRFSERPQGPASPVRALLGPGVEPPDNTLLRSIATSLDKRPVTTWRGPLALAGATGGVAALPMSPPRFQFPAMADMRATLQTFKRQEAWLVKQGTHPLALSATVFGRDMLWSTVGGMAFLGATQLAGVTDPDTQFRFTQAGMMLGGLGSLYQSVAPLLTGPTSELGCMLFNASALRMLVLMAPTAALIDGGLKAAGMENATARLLVSNVAGAAVSFAFTRYFGVSSWNWGQTLALTAATGLAAYTAHKRA